MDIEKKTNSKAYRFFDWLYKLLIMNVFTILSIIPIITAFPAIVATYATIKKDMKEPGIFKRYFSNYKKYFLKSFIVGILLLIVGLIIGFSFYFYAFGIPQDETNNFLEGWDILFQMGVVVMFILALVIIMVGVHLPLIIITFEMLTIGEIIRTSFYISFRYIISTLILIGMFIFQIIGVLALPIWFLFGISLPILLGIKFTNAIYYNFEKIDLESILRQAEEDLDE